MKTNVTKFEKEHWFFITSTIHNHNKLFHNKKYAKIVLKILNYFVKSDKLYIGAFVIMPNHIHLIIKTKNDNKISDLNRNFKKFTSQQIILHMTNIDDKLINDFIVNKKDRKI